MGDDRKKKLPTEPYKGVRDFYPEDMFIQNYLKDTMQEIVEGFGYVEYSSSILEPAELYEAKSGDEIVEEQTYTFTDRGERRVTLRPEMTPSVARLVAARKRDLAFPLRWYSLPNVFRYERPQRGRLREHWQLNCDIFGVPGNEADIEIIVLASKIMQAFGAKDTEFEIRVNSRTLLENYLAENLKDQESIPDALRLLDKKDKLSETEFTEEWKHLSPKSEKPDITADEEIDQLIEALKQRGVENVVFNPTLTRGFDYYSGIVFEVYDLAPLNNRSLFGGGRYDNLLDIFGVESVPAVGFGMGDVTMRDFLETHGLLPEYIPSTDLYIGTLDQKSVPYAQKLASKLRMEGLSVAVNLVDKKIGDQVKVAGKQAIPFFLALGDEEITSNVYKLKNLSSGEEKEVKEGEIAALIWGEGLEE